MQIRLTLKVTKKGRKGNGNVSTHGDEVKRGKLTIGLCCLNLGEERLEPPEARGITDDPDELDTLEGAQITLALAVPNV